MKTCRKCEVELVVGENWNESQARGRQYICRPCTNAKQAEYRKANPGYDAEYYKANREKKLAQRAEYAKANPGKTNANTAKRRALIKQQTPSWYCHETVTAIYEVAAEFGYHVDHIVPLSKGGLHSHENLQLLTPEENMAKGASDAWIA